MVDISKCHGDGCPLKKNCYRYVVKGNQYYQSYFMNDNYNNEKKNCEYYWKLKDD